MDISGTSTPAATTVPMKIHVSARPKQKTTSALTYKQQPREEAAPKRCPYHAALGKPVTNELPPKWAKNEEVFYQLKEEIMPPPSIKPKSLI